MERRRIILIDRPSIHLLLRLATGPCPPATFEMEGRTAEDGYSSQGLFHGNFFQLPAVHSLLSTAHSLLLASATVTPGMGRKPWATRLQLEYLRSFVHMLPQAKRTTGLTTLYMQVYEGFISKWKPLPLAPKSNAPPESCTPEALEFQAKKQLRKVCIMSNTLCCCAYSLPAHLELVQRRTKEVEAP